MAAVAQVQTSSPASPVSGTGHGAVQSDGDTGFLATLDGVIQAMSANGAAPKAGVPANNIPATASVPAATAASTTVPATDATAASGLSDSAADTAVPAATSGKAAKATLQASAVPVAAPPVIGPASAAATATVQAGTVTGSQTDADAVPQASDNPVDPADTGMLSVTLSHPVKFSGAAPSGKADTVADPAETDPAEAADATGAANNVSAPSIDDTTLAPTKTGNKKSDTADSQPDAVAAAPADTASTMMLAMVASQLQAVSSSPADSHAAAPAPAQDDTVAAAGQGTRASAPLPLVTAGPAKGAIVETSVDDSGRALSAANDSPLPNASQAIPAVDLQPAAPSTKQASTSVDNAGPQAQANTPTPAVFQPPAQPDAVADSDVEKAKPAQADADILPAAPTVSHAPASDISLTIQPQSAVATDTVKATADGAGLTAPSPTEQVSLVIHKGLIDGNSSMTIALDPADLGKVEVKLDIAKDGSVQASIVADRPETLTLLKNDNAGLHQALHNAGLSTDSSSLNFSLRGDNQGQGFAQAQQQQQSARENASYRIQASLVEENSTALPVTGTQYASSSGNSRVDLFV